MSDINYKELFEHYYQKDYDFNTSSLSAEQIKDIKQTARQMRVDYALAPMGTLSLIHISEPTDTERSRMPSSA